MLKQTKSRQITSPSFLRLRSSASACYALILLQSLRRSCLFALFAHHNRCLLMVIYIVAHICRSMLENVVACEIDRLDWLDLQVLILSLVFPSSLMNAMQPTCIVLIIGCNRKYLLQAMSSGSVTNAPDLIAFHVPVLTWCHKGEYPRTNTVNYKRPVIDISI